MIRGEQLVLRDRVEGACRSQADRRDSDSPGVCRPGREVQRYMWRTEQRPHTASVELQIRGENGVAERAQRSPGWTRGKGCGGWDGTS